MKFGMRIFRCIAASIIAGGGFAFNAYGSDQETFDTRAELEKFYGDDIKFSVTEKIRRISYCSNRYCYAIEIPVAHSRSELEELASLYFHAYRKDHRTFSTVLTPQRQRQVRSILERQVGICGDAEYHDFCVLQFMKKEYGATFIGIDHKNDPKIKINNTLEYALPKQKYKSTYCTVSTCEIFEIPISKNTNVVHDFIYLYYYFVPPHHVIPKNPRFRSVQGQARVRVVLERNRGKCDPKKGIEKCVLLSLMKTHGIKYSEINYDENHLFKGPISHMEFKKILKKIVKM